MKSLKKRNKKEIVWPVLKALNDLYHQQKTSAKIQQDAFIRYLLEQTDIIAQKKGNNNILIAHENYNEFYENNFLEVYQHYYVFLERAGISPDARKTFTEEDIRTLMMVYESRIELKGKLTNLEDFSAKVFDYGGSKYLKFHDSVRNAVMTILEIDEFPQTEKDLQYRLVVDYTDPKAVIFCENKSFLKQPWIAKELEVKLWYVGGNNIKIVDDIDQIDLQYPIYYSCDWDFDGLRIYQRIKSKLKHRGTEIKLLIPPPPHLYLPSDSFKHNSRWKNNLEYSGLSINMFTTVEKKLIEKLIKYDQWIEEESNVLKEMYFYNLKVHNV